MTTILRPQLAPSAVLVLSLCSAACSSVFAQSGVKVEPLTLYPTASLSYGYNDNVLLTSTRVSSNTTVFAAGLRAELESGKNKYSLGYGGTFGRYASSSVDNYNYHDVNALADLSLTSRATLKLGADYTWRSDPRGSLPTAFTPSPNEYNQTGVTGLFSYGAPGAQGRIELEGGYSKKSYETNRALTSVFDVDVAKAGATFFWRFAPKTEWLIQAATTNSDYTAATATLDNTEYRVMTGLKWEATALTQGAFKIGHSKKKVDGGRGLRDSSGFVWDASVLWSPLSYSKVQLSTGKNFNDALAGGNSTINSYVRGAWNHDWTDRIATNVSASSSKDDYSGLANGRKDTTNTLGFGVSYAMQRWLTFGADYTYSRRDTNVTNLGYNKNLFMFSAKVAL